MYRAPQKKFLWINVIFAGVVLLYFFPNILTEGPAAIVLQPNNLANVLLAILILVTLAPFLSIRGSVSKFIRYTSRELRA